MLAHARCRITQTGLQRCNHTIPEQERKNFEFYSVQKNSRDLLPEQERKNFEFCVANELPLSKPPHFASSRISVKPNTNQEKPIKTFKGSLLYLRPKGQLILVTY
jgi:hypothetical protein